MTPTVGPLGAHSEQRVAGQRGPQGAVVTVLVDTGLKYLAGAL